MKCFLSVLLCGAIILCFAAIPAAAETPRPKLSPALSEKLDTFDPSQPISDRPTVVAYYSSEVKSIDDMPDFPAQSALSDYSKLIKEQNDQAVDAIFENHEFLSRYINIWVPGCLIISEVTPYIVSQLEDSDLIRSIDLVDYRSNDYGAHKKYDYVLNIVLNVFGPDDYVCVWVNNAEPMLGIYDMPSWTDISEPDDSAARNEYKVYKETFADQFTAKAFDGIDAAIFGSYGFMTIAAVKVSDLETLAARDCVGSIYYNENAIPENEDVLVPTIDYRQKLIDQYDIPDRDLPYLEYNELIRHPYGFYDENSGLLDDRPYAYDWVLVSALDNALCYCEEILNGVIGGRSVQAFATVYVPFTFTFGIYDAEKDRFFDLSEIDFEDYDGLFEAWQKLSRDDSVYLRDAIHGDADGDEQITILDATKIQRLLAGIDAKYDLDLAGADADGDGDVAIVDATRIQRFKANLCDLDGKPIEPEPMTVSVQFEDHDNVYSNNHVTVSVSGGKMPYQYKYTIKGGVHAYSDYHYGQFGDYHSDDTDPMPGDFKITTGYTDSNMTTIPVDGITYGDSFTLIVTVRDKRGVESEPIKCYFLNSDGGEVLRFDSNKNNAEDTAGSILVKVKTGEPRSLARARNTVLNTLSGFEIASIGMLVSTETSVTFKVDLTEKSEQNDQRAIDVLVSNADVLSASAYRGEFSRYEPDGFAPGRVIVSGTVYSQLNDFEVIVSGSDYGQLLKGFEIEEIRLLTPGSARTVYLIIFKEKTKEIVWRALELLENYPSIEYAEPDFYGSFDV